MSKFCIRCGVEEPELIVDGFCIKCLVDLGKVVKPPNSVKVTVCPTCSSIKTGSKWLLNTDLKEHLRDVVLGDCVLHNDFKLSSLNIDLGGSKALVSFKGYLRGVEVVKDYILDLTINKALCPQCSRVKGGYYEAVIQIRTYLNTFNKSLMDKLVNTLLKSPNISNNISEIEFVKEGLDVKVLSIGIARKLASDIVSTYGGTSSESWKVVGKSSSGKKVSKLTISLRILGLTPGEYVVFKDRLAVVEDIAGTHVKIKFLDVDHVVRLNVDDLSEGDLSDVHVELSELIDAKVTGVYEGKAIVRDVCRGNTYEIPVYGGVKVGSKVKLLIYKDRIYLAGIEM
ncbi:MAG: 60S ribosomal export protein NMD3 [Sulfolobales archaeon]|nr:60S ribosomal export protein NMD3 [Sulfolobales archaeon]